MWTDEQLNAAKYVSYSDYENKQELGVGTIEILTASDVGINQMRRIGRPLEFKRAMLDAKRNYAHGFGYLDPQAVAAYTQPQAQPGGSDLQQTLQKLADLRDQGLLSQAEFDAKKRELLSRV